jgi:hypothetical protein
VSEAAVDLTRAVNNGLAVAAREFVLGRSDPHHDGGRDAYRSAPRERTDSSRTAPPSLG